MSRSRRPLATITGNIASAQAYESYLANASVIGALVAAEPDSVFAIETAITLARAVELGLTRRAASAAEVEFAANDNEVVQNIAARKKVAGE